MGDNLHLDKIITTQSIQIPKTSLVIEGCRIYTVSGDDEFVGKFYTNLKFSYGKIGNKEIIIEFKNDFFGKPLHFIKDASSGQELAKIQSSGNSLNLQLKLDIEGQYQYCWEDISSEYKSIFRPNTWSIYAARLSNGPIEVILKGRLHRKIIDTVYDYLVPFSGEIEFNESYNPLILICALYMLETDLYYRNQGNLDY